MQTSKLKRLVPSYNKFRRRQVFTKDPTKGKLLIVQKGQATKILLSSARTLQQQLYITGFS